MGVIDVSAGFPEVCVTKANEKLSALFDGMTGLSEEEQFERLLKHYNLIKECADRCLDNFDPKKFIERENNKKSPKELQHMVMAAIQAALILDVLIKKMENSPLSRVNGTSSIFAQCADNAIIIQNTLATGLGVYNQEMQRRQDINLAAE